MYLNWVFSKDVKVLINTEIGGHRNCCFILVLVLVFCIVGSHVGPN